METYDTRIFHAVAELIRDRDHTLDDDEIKRQTLRLMSENVTVASALSVISKHPKSQEKELEKLQKRAKSLAEALGNLSLAAEIELSYFSRAQPVPDLKCLELDAKKLCEVIREGLKTKRAVRRRSNELIERDSLIEEATNVFEQAYGVNLNGLGKPRAPKNKNIKSKYFIFIRRYMPDQHHYETDSQFETLKTAAKRYLKSKRKNRRIS